MDRWVDGHWQVWISRSRECDDSYAMESHSACRVAFLLWKTLKQIVGWLWSNRMIG